MANGSGPSSEDIARDLHTSIDVKELVTSMREKIQTLSPLSPNCCIYRVPKRLRQVNEKSYTPLMVSIGPLHHDKQSLEAMDEYKWRYLKDFLEHSQKPMKDFLEFIREREERVRECYAETISLNSDKFVEIVLVDAAFVVEIFLRNYWFPNLKTDSDHIYGKPWLIRDIRCDLLLLENQIPFFVLEDLFLMADIKVGSNQDDESTPTFKELARKFFADSVELSSIGAELTDCSEVAHFTDFLRRSLKPRESKTEQCEKGKKVESIRSATELKEAGVKFRVSSNKKLTDIEFRRGVLFIPRIRITGRIEDLLRNLLVFEQCHYRNGYVSDYVEIMDNLINTYKDVELLVHKGVLQNSLGDSQEVSNLFNKLSNEILLDTNSFHFSELCKELNDHCGNTWNKSKATLRHDYCKTPWRVLSVVAAAILLLLSIIQTVCSLISVIY